MTTASKTCKQQRLLNPFAGNILFNVQNFKQSWTFGLNFKTF